MDKPEETTHDVLHGLAKERNRSFTECCGHFVQYIKARRYGDLPDELARASLDALEAMPLHQVELWTRSDEAVPLYEPAKKYAAYMRESGEQLPSLSSTE